MAFLTEKDRQYHTPEDICAHVGDEYGKYSGAIVPPIYQNSLFVLPTESNDVATAEYSYTRSSNPTIDIAERKIAALEGGDGALCFSSGMGAISSAVLHFVTAGCHVVLVATSYSCTLRLVKNYLKKFDITYTLVDGDSLEEIEAAIQPNTKLIYVESPSSLIFKMQDLEGIAEMAKARGIGTVIDNTYATPLHQQPLRYGIDIVCHTASKYMGGHSDIVAGALVARREIIQSIQSNERSLLGGNMDPHQAWLLIRGLRTLPLRVKQHGANAMKVAAFLENHPKVDKVFYPGSATYTQPEMFQKYLSGTNGLMSFTVKGGAESAKKLVNSLHYFQNGCSWGGFESLCILLGSDDASRAAGQPDNLIRIHVGLEDVNTLIEDLEQGLEKLI